MSKPFKPERETHPFHDGPAIHTRCAHTATGFNVSKACQKSHWPEHKLSCKEIVKHDKDLLAQTGIPHAYTDLLQWIEFYATPIKNCLVAALNLPQSPHQQRNSILGVRITHKRDSTLPVQLRFTIDSIERLDRGTGNILTDPSAMLDSPTVQHSTEFGKVEMGKDYYGTAMFIVQAAYGPMAFRRFLKCFSIDKDVARAKVMSGPWEPTLRDLLENGKKMRFCCGKIEGVQGCCCGGWVHDENAKKGDPWR